MTETAAQGRTYSGWQPEKSGFIGRLSLTGFVLVAAAAVVMLVPIYRSSWSSLLMAAPVAGLLVTVAYARVSGLSADEWVGLAARHWTNGARRRNAFVSGAFAPDTIAAPGGAGDAAEGAGRVQPMDLPGPLACLRILSAPTGTGRTGAVVYDPLANTYAAVLRLRPPGLALADTDRQDRRVASWGGFLAGVCVEDGPVSRVAVTERSLPDDGTALRSWVADHTVSGAPTAAVEALDELMAEAGPSSNSRDTFLTVTIDASRARTKVKAAGGGQLGACAVLMREVAVLRPAIEAGELQIVDVLAPRDLAEVVRTAFDPHSVPALTGRRSSAPATPTGSAQVTAAGADGEADGPIEAGVDPALAGPAAATTSWGVYRHDGGWSVTYQVRDWPRASVFATVLQPLTKPKDRARRSFALICEPLGPRRAERELTRERTKRQTLISLRRRTGRVDSPDEVRELSRSEAQDSARAAGHGVLRFTAMVTVTVTDPGHLDDACAELEADAAMAKLELRRLWGAQDSGFAAAAVPLGQGLPAKRTPL